MNAMKWNYADFGLVFYIEASNFTSFQTLLKECQEKTIFKAVAKRISAIIDSRDLVPEHIIKTTYEIPKNSICIPSNHDFNIGPENEYCNKVREMMIKLGPKIYQKIPDIEEK